MKARIKWLCAVWFCSRMIYYFSRYADLNVFVWEEIYWFITWGSLIYFCYVVRYLILKSKEEQPVKILLRKHIFKLALLFVSLFLWEIVNCISTQIAYSDSILLVMGIIAAVLIVTMINTRE